MKGYLYILQSRKNKKYYVGSTNDWERREIEHKEGKSNYTRDLRPLETKLVQEFGSLSTARKYENWLKKQKDRSLIERIISEGGITEKDKLTWWL